MSINTLGMGQNGWQYANDIFKSIFLREKYEILIKISGNFVPRGSIDNMSALVQAMAWHRISEKPSHEPMLTKSHDAIWN